eukprot:2066976-Alexandrium_andersonii.AAC.1
MNPVATVSASCRVARIAKHGHRAVRGSTSFGTKLEPSHSQSDPSSAVSKAVQMMQPNGPSDSVGE